MKADFPMKHPDYSFDHAPTPEELRQTAIRAMHDMLSAEWYSPESFVYHKKGAASGKTYAFEKDTVYGGLPYTDCNVSLFAFLEYIDPVTGQLKVPEVMEGFDDLGIAVNNRLGNTCTGSTGWGVLSVCQSVRGGLVSYYLLPKNGFFPLGDIEIDPELDTFVKEPTDGICARYGLQTLCRAYALVQGADLVVQQPVNPSAGHSMMALETPHVVYTEDGQIDAEESRLGVQDQYTGTFFQKNEAVWEKIPGSFPTWQHLKSSCYNLQGKPNDPFRYQR